ncbi:MAG: recombinase family protein [Planctomycetota bacterium]
MPVWWKKEEPTEATKRAVAYYRHSAEDKQENSVPLQRQEVTKFAREHGIKIIKEFADRGKSGLTTRGRHAFNEMIEDYVIGGKEDFDYILVLDVSRWGRFQNADLAAYYVALCEFRAKKVIYTTIGFQKGDDPMDQVRIAIERVSAAKDSQVLSRRVFNGSLEVARQGFRAGAPAPYGLHRLLLDEQRKPVQILQPGQKKVIDNQRVTLAPGDDRDVRIVRRIFTQCAEGRTPSEIAAALNAEGIPSRAGKRWTGGSVRSVLANELYVGTMVYNKTRQKLQARTKPNPPEEWVRKKHAFEGIVDEELFARARKALAARKTEHERRHSPEDMIRKLERVHRRYGKVGPRQIASDKKLVSPSAYVKRFLSLDLAYQRMFDDARDRARRSVLDELGKIAGRVEEVDDLVVLDDRFSLLIQPSVPVAYGYGEYWAFLPDPREEVDITLGVPLSNSGRYEILGYLLFPKILVESRGVKLFSSSDVRLELHGYGSLEMVGALLE